MGQFRSGSPLSTASASCYVTLLRQSLPQARLFLRWACPMGLARLYEQPQQARPSLLLSSMLISVWTTLVSSLPED